MLTAAIRALIDAHARRHGVPAEDVQVQALDCWQLEASFRLPDGHYRLRTLGAGDEEALWAFGAQLGPEARELFCPYPWHDIDRCRAAFESAIAQSVRRIDASYLLEHDGAPIGHFFLWKAGGNPHSRASGLEIPELGVALADAYTGRGLGSLAVRTLQAVARALGADAIELTTAPTNDAGWQTYVRAGFIYVGMLRIPLEVDVTAAELGEVTATRFRDERQMVDLLRPARRQAVLDFLARKRTA